VCFIAIKIETGALNGLRSFCLNRSACADNRVKIGGET